MVEKVHGALKKNGGTIENWFTKTITYTSGKPSDTIVIGYIQNDKRWEDGVFIFTSAVVNISSDETSLETLNTFYKLGEKDPNPPKYDRWLHGSCAFPPTCDPYEINDSGKLDW